MDECLRDIKERYHLIIYTASDQSYADSVLDYIDPAKKYFSLRLYRHNCVKTVSDGNTIYIKDLRIIKNVKLKNMLIIDNSVLSFAFHLDNGIPILPYYNNKKDREMLFLRDYLMNLSNTEDFRISNSKIFNLKRLLKETVEDEVLFSDGSPKEDDPSPSSSSSEDEQPAEKLDKKLNKPVRRESKFQFALTETLQNAHKNVIKVITDTCKEEENENDTKESIEKCTKASAECLKYGKQPTIKSKSNTSVFNLSDQKKRNSQKSQTQTAQK